LSDNATPAQIVTRLVELAPTMASVQSGFADVADTTIMAGDLPALGVIVGRVLDLRWHSLANYTLVQEYILFLHTDILGERRPFATDQQQANALSYLLPLIAFFANHDRLQLNDRGIVHRAELSPDGIPRRTVRDKIHYLGMAARLRVTTHHTK
jgi:hypothetical protein